MSRQVVLVEIAIPFCKLTYGVAPCAAQLGVTGDRKCFNVIRTCQDRANYSIDAANPLTLFFCEPSEDIEFTRFGQPVAVIPSLKSISVTPAVINPGVDIGQRESVRVTLHDHPHSDAGIDKYVAERDYDPFQLGTLWGKLRARVRSFEGFTLRVYRGEYGTPLEQMTRYTYVIDSLVAQGESVSIVAKDPLILTDKKRAQAPRMSNGVLASAISSTDGSLTLSPPGIGDFEYPPSGKVAIAGKEICTFTRSGDVLTLTQRGASGTEAQNHNEGDRVQLVLTFDAAPPADIVIDLLVGFTPGIDPVWINVGEWQEEVNEYINRLYTAEIAEPTPVVDLLNELIEQVGLVLWWDPTMTRLMLQSLRPVESGARLYSEDHMMVGSFKAAEQPQRRISEVWTYFGLRNPLEPLDEASNYKAAIATVDPEAGADYGQPAIKRIFSRWISDNNRGAAARLNSMLLARYRDAPRKFSFSLYNTIEEVPSLGGGFRLDHWTLQDDTGASVPVPAQVTSLEQQIDRYVVDAQESIYVQQDDLETVRLIFLDQDQFNVNLRTVHDSIYPAPEDGDQIRVYVNGHIGSRTSSPAFDVGSWPANIDIEIIVNGRIQGRGGFGGHHLFDSSLNGGNGGTAFFTRYPVKVSNLGRIDGGGGGGGAGQLVNLGTELEPIFRSGPGGGGAGFNPGLAMFPAQQGTIDAGGNGGTDVTTGGAGGGPGQPGAFGGGGLGGAAGAAVDGESFITYDVVGLIRGPRIN